MRELQRRLAERLELLRAERTGPVFFLEHGLTETEVEELFEAVRALAAWRPPADSCWDIHPLPLLVAATEVGYRYRGAGTDYWPRLEERLRLALGDVARKRVRDLFRAAARQYGGACPPDSRWARAFHLIAWPITHALVPVEFHRTLAAALAGLRARVDGMDDGELYRAVKFAAGHASARFETFLADEGLVVQIARQILDVGESELGAEALARIKDDLQADEVARRYVAVAKHVQRTARRGTAPAEPVRAPAAVHGQVQLRVSTEQRLVLEAWFSGLDQSTLEPLRRMLRRRRYAPRLWGVSARVPSEQLLSGLPFLLNLASCPDPQAELLPGVMELDLRVEQRQLLEALKLDLASTMVFAVAADGDLARFVRGTELSSRKVYWLLATGDAAGTLKTFPKRGEVGPYGCFELDPEAPEGAEVLRRLGFRLRRGLAISFAGAPPLDALGDVPRFAVDDRLAVVPRRPPSGDAFVTQGDCEQPFGDGLVQFPVLEGEDQLTVTSHGVSRGYLVRGVEFGESVPAHVCSLELRAPEQTVQALLGGRMSLSVDSHAPLQGLELTLELEVAGERTGVTSRLEPLPATLGEDSEVWSALLADCAPLMARTDSSVTLHAHVGGLVSASWSLERRVRPCWWQADGPAVRLVGELGAQAFGGVSASHPLRLPDRDLTEADSDALLLVPIDVDAAEHGPSAEFTTLCVAPRRVGIGAPVADKPRLRRGRRAASPSAGLEDLLEAYLRWTLAESTTLEARVRQWHVTALLDGWVSELTCGEAWARREADLRAVASDPWRLLGETLCQTGLGRDAEVEVSAEDEVRLARLSVSEIRAALPGLWAQLGPPADLVERDYEALDLACSRGYVRLAQWYTEYGQEEFAAVLREGDPGTVDEDWDVALRQIKVQVELRELADLLLPSDLDQGLVTLDFTVLSLGDLTEELVRWSSRAEGALAGRGPSASALEAILALWVAPERAVELDWRGALDTLLAERCVARAARYLALRSRATSMEGHP